jgi:hypothetical protein
MTSTDIVPGWQAPEVGEGFGFLEPHCMGQRGERRLHTEGLPKYNHLIFAGQVPLSIPVEIRNLEPDIGCSVSLEPTSPKS